MIDFAPDPHRPDPASDPDARTATPDWDGEAMDVELVLQALRPHPLAGRSVDGGDGFTDPPAESGTDPGPGAGDVSAETSWDDTHPGAGARPGNVSLGRPADDSREADDRDADARWRPLRTGGEGDPPGDHPPPAEH